MATMETVMDTTETEMGITETDMETMALALATAQDMDLTTVTEVPMLRPDITETLVMETKATEYTEAIRSSPNLDDEAHLIASRNNLDHDKFARATFDHAKARS